MLYEQQMPEKYEIIGSNFTIFSKEFNYMNINHFKNAESEKKIKNSNLNKAWIDPSRIKKRISIFTNKVKPVTESGKKLDFSYKQKDHDAEFIVRSFGMKDIKMLVKL